MIKKPLFILLSLALLFVLNGCKQQPAGTITFDSLPHEMVKTVDTSIPDTPSTQENEDQKESITPEKNPGNGLDALATCLTEKGIKMYGTDWCGHCQNQKKKFGDSFKKVTYVNCETQFYECEKAGVTGYPTWIFADGEMSPGTKTLEFLSKKSGCKF